MTSSWRGASARRSRICCARAPRSKPPSPTSAPAAPPSCRLLAVDSCPLAGSTSRGYADQPVSTTGAASAVAAFMPGFLAWSHGRAPATAINHATAGFIARARSHPPTITPAEHREHTRVLRIRVLAGHPPVAVVDLAPSTGIRSQLDFYLIHADGRWQTSQLATPG